MGVSVHEAASFATIHTVLTDVLGHEKHGYITRRSAYHDYISLFLGLVIALITQNPVYLWLGAIHVILDWLSPGKLGVSYPYSLMWAMVPAIILYTLGISI
jgi:hypothetical protein